MHLPWCISLLLLLDPPPRLGGGIGIVVVGAFVVGPRLASSSSSSSSPRGRDVRRAVVRDGGVDGVDGGDDEGLSGSGGGIFFDDFSGLSVGEAVGGTPSSSSSSSSSSISSETKATIIVPGGGDGRKRPSFELPEYDGDDGDDGGGGDDDDGGGPGGGGGGRRMITIPLPRGDASIDLSGSACREFGLGTDVVLINYAGSAGYDLVTDWQYYEVDVDGDDGSERRRTPIVGPRPMDPDMPSRTRERGGGGPGGVVRLFRGELAGGTLGSRLRSRGLDARVWIKVRERETINLFALCLVARRRRGSSG